MKTNAQQKYVETSIATSAKEDLIVKIFDVLVLASQQALDKLRNTPNDIEGIHKALLRGQRACALLMGSLDMEIGGELAKSLFRVYEFWHHELVMANMQKDASRVERVIGFAEDYRATWSQAVALFKAQKNPAASMTRVAAASGSTSTFAAVG